MPSLADYTSDVRNLLRDPNAQFYTASQITSWINKARRRVAMNGQCVRVIPPSSGYLTAITVTDGGSGYTGSPTVTISAPDAMGVGWVQATATATLMGGSVSSITITNPGTGYVTTPAVTITGTGTGATATAALSSFLATVANQEVYSFGTANTLIQANMPGYGDILGIQGVSVSWGSLRPTLKRADFSWLQAQLRSYPIMQNYPDVWAQYGQGVAGTMYLFPIPSQVAQMEWDCYCSVLDLSSGQTVDAIPEPFCEAVQYWAAHLGFLSAQRPADASQMESLFNSEMLTARAGVSTATVPSFYPMGW